MTAESLRGWFRRRPFQSFDVRTTTGAVHPIREIGTGIVTKSQLVLGRDERLVFVPLSDIVSVEPTRLDCL